MDSSYIINLIRWSILTQNINSNFIDRQETLYYDESGNVKHLIVKNGKLNVPENIVFVLGGIQAEDCITLDELKNFFEKTSDSELKENKDLKGTFVDILKKDNFRKTLQLLLDKQWHIHFCAVQILYFAFVDIIDSIDGLEDDSNEFKAVLYDVLKKNPQGTTSMFAKYKYPNVPTNKIGEFLSDLITMIESSILEDKKEDLISPYLIVLKTNIEKAKIQDRLEFIQDEEPHKWVSAFAQFYRNEIWKFPNKTLIFDEEKQVSAYLKGQNFKYNGLPLDNFCFKDSSSDAMIQISDYIVCILRKYLVFLDRKDREVESDLNQLDELQTKNFILFNKVLKNSTEFNPTFVNFIASDHTIKKYNKYMEIWDRR